jgi:hypothetical protein
MKTTTTTTKTAKFKRGDVIRDSRRNTYEVFRVSGNVILTLCGKYVHVTKAVKVKVAQ